MPRSPRRRRSAKAGVEQAALTHWATAYPVTAMRLLAEAGYDRPAREEFLRNVVQLPEEHVPDYAADSFVQLDR